MIYPFDYFQHRRDCQHKQASRASTIATLPRDYHLPLSAPERAILNTPIQDLVSAVHSRTTTPLSILHTYGKTALVAQSRTNCITEILFPSAERWLQDGSINLSGPLAGIPVSLKDSIVVGGYDVSVGYSRKTGHPHQTDGAMVRMLKDAGAVPFVKTNLPVTLLSFESTNDVWGRTTNPHNAAYSPGGSTGGEAALLASGGSRIGIGSDVAGSVRAPAHFSGCYSLRCSTGRWPKAGMDTSMPGQEGIASVFSPMARTLNDLSYFTKAFVGMKPWLYDHSVHPLEWRDSVAQEFGAEKKRLKVGVLRSDGVVDPSPACARALQVVCNALEVAGHDVYDVTAPAEALPKEALVIASHLLNADGCRTLLSFFRTGEANDPGAAQMTMYMRLPRPLKYLHYLWVKYVRGDALWAELLGGWHEKSAFEQWKLVSRREAFKAKWHEWWGTEEGDMDVLLTVPNATPAVPHGGMREAVASCGYTFLFNLLDYTAGVLPITHVDPIRDALPAGFSARKLNGVAQGAYKHYDAKRMAGLPVGVQVVGRRLEEEKVLAVMGRIEDALGEEKYALLEVD